jgi:hypothetical protein
MYATTRGAPIIACALSQWLYLSWNENSVFASAVGMGVCCFVLFRVGMRSEHIIIRVHQVER